MTRGYDVRKAEALAQGLATGPLALLSSVRMKADCVEKCIQQYALGKQ